MRAYELMIDDWVYNKNIDKPMQVYPMMFSQMFRQTPDATTEDYNIFPIPITPEILEKNGFVANKHVYPYPYYEYINGEDKLKIGFAFPQGNRTSYKDPWIYLDSEHVFIEHLPCVFVHQLQQILRLCGIEKEIKL
jgi:hypothetical protein